MLQSRGNISLCENPPGQHGVFDVPEKALGAWMHINILLLKEKHAKRQLLYFVLSALY